MDQVLQWSLIAGGVFLVVVFAGVFIRKVVTGKPITSVLVITLVLFSISAGMATYLAGSIKTTIDEREMIGDREEAVIERLQLIREAQLVYQEINGKYTSNWDSLIAFIKDGQYPIIQKSEEIITLDYGADSVIVHLDTIGQISVFDRIFKANYAENSIDSGTFVEFHVAEGGQAVKGTKAYTIINRNNREFTRNFANNGTVTKLEEVQKGDRVTKGQLLISFWEYQFNPNVKLEELMYVPGYAMEDGVKFEIFTSKIPSGPAAANLMVDVVEVKNPKPFNPERKESNEAKNKRPLRFGSRTDATTSGNWE